MSLHGKLTHYDPIGQPEFLLFSKNLMPPSCPHKGVARFQASGSSWASPSAGLAATGPQSSSSPRRGGTGQLPENICPVHPEDTCSFPCGWKRGIYSNMGLAVNRSNSIGLTVRWVQRKAGHGRPGEGAEPLSLVIVAKGNCV